MTYCMADIHGCYDEFIRLLERIKFSDTDELYILGDIIHRGDAVMECIAHIKQAKNIRCLQGNHEAMMLEYYGIELLEYAARNNNASNKKDNSLFIKTAFEDIQPYPSLRFTDSADWLEFINWVRDWPSLKIVTVNQKQFILSHAGINPQKPISEQSLGDLHWSREEFFSSKGLPGYICIFGHTPTCTIRNDYNCAIWIDEKYRDKICIDCGCVFGGALAALRLDDGAVFYEKSIGKRDYSSVMKIERDTDAVDFIIR